MADLAARNKNYQQKFRNKKKEEAQEDAKEAQRVIKLVETRDNARKIRAANPEARGLAFITKLKLAITKRLIEVDGQIQLTGSKQSELIDDIEYLLIHLKRYESEHINKWARVHNP